MLQQTQVDRVIPFYRIWLKKFPNFTTLAATSMREVLIAWQGLGYNRRALALKHAAETIVREHSGCLPRDLATLRMLPGIGAYTAAAVATFAFDQPVLCIETNIRRAFIHHFFPTKRRVSDTQIVPLIERTLDRAHPRRWYTALMDYGSWLATQVANPNHRSRHYVRQSRFKGSDRQLRGRIVKSLLTKERNSIAQLAKELKERPSRIAGIVTSLRQEGFLKMKKRSIVLT